LPIYGWILCVLIAVYMSLLALKRERRDLFALILVAALCVAFGLRSVEKLMPYQDPVIYSTLISRVMVSDVSFKELGIDYLPLFLVQFVTRGALSVSGAFLLIHLLYLVFILPIYRFTRAFPGVFHIFAGWMMFANSGVLLLCNFLRQGYAILLFLGLLLSVSTAGRRYIRLVFGLIALPFLHISAMVLAPSLLLLRRRRYFLAYGLIFALAIAWICRSPESITADAADPDAAAAQLYLKIAGAYFLLGLGYLADRRNAEASTELRSIERAAAGVVLPCAALLLLRDPGLQVHGLRFVYWIHAPLFLYLAAVVSSRKSEAMLRVFAVALCVFGVVTWSHPNVATLLIW
jgi:hypothetical protein